MCATIAEGTAAERFFAADHNAVWSDISLILPAKEVLTHATSLFHGIVLFCGTEGFSVYKVLWQRKISLHHFLKSEFPRHIRVNITTSKFFTCYLPEKI
jgi:hypothetical protein